MTAPEYNECVEMFADPLFRYCVTMTQNEMDADDLVQISFERLWENREKIDQKAAKNWLFRTAYRAMIDTFRKQKRIDRYRNDQEEGVLEVEKEMEHSDLLKQALTALTPEQKNLILMRDYEGYSYRELCELTGMSMSNVKVSLFRIRKVLKEKLLEMDFTEFKKN